jgi:cobalt-zinc-cadmium efflux system outer membrane protein
MPDLSATPAGGAATRPGRTRHGRRRPAAPGALLLGALALAGCATPTRDDSERAVRDRVAAVSPATGPGLDGALSGDAAATDARLAALRAQPLTPPAAVEIALLRSPTVGAAFASLGLSRADLIGATRLSNPTLGGSRIGVDGQYRTTIDFALALNDLLLLPARRRLGAAGFERTQRLVAQEMLTLVADVETAYYSAVSARQVAIMRDAVANAAGLSAELAQRFFEAGNITPLQLATERAGASQAKLDAARAAVAARIQRLALLRTIGVGQDPAWTLADTLPQPVPPQADEAALLQLAQRQRADLDGARREVALLEDTLQVVRRWRLLGEARVGGEREREPSGERLSGPRLELALPIFDQGQPGITRATAQLEASRAALRDLELAVGNDVRNALDRWTTAAGLVAEFERALVPAQQAIVAQQQLQQNFMLVGQFELLLAKQREYDAWQGYLEAIRDYWIARTDLERAIGSALPGAPQPGAPVVGPQDLPGMPAEPDLDRRGQSPEEPQS